MTALLASIVEAFGELRVNKGRILLSLIGVAFSVFALTLVMGGGTMLTSALVQSQETWSGRDAVISLYSAVEPDADGGSARTDAQVLQELERMGITQRTRYITDSLRVQTPHGVIGADITGVDPSYQDMYRVTLAQGRWLAASDAQRLVPVLVVNQYLYEQMGSPELGTRLVPIYGPSGAEEAQQALIVGVLAPSPMAEEWPMAYMPAAAMGSLPGRTSAPPTYEYRIWVPPDQAEEVQVLLSSRLNRGDQPSFDISTSSLSAEDTGIGGLTTAVTAVALVILVLGTLGLVNISLVTVRYRVREIGIRRSYGASGGRIFMGVLMESVVATVVAGGVGVSLAVALVKSPWVSDWLRSNGLVAVPPFPITAVLMGLGAATAVGVLAGALPALIATRIRVIDAIRS